MSTTTAGPALTEDGLDVIAEIIVDVDLDKDIPCQAPSGCPNVATWHMTVTHEGDTAPCSGLLCCDQHKAHVVTMLQRTAALAAFTGGRMITICQPHSRRATVNWRAL